MKTSKQPRKQRKKHYTAPLHRRRKYLSARLGKELRKKHKKANFPLRKGDRVKVITGEYKKRTGKITKVNLKEYKINVEGITVKKPDGKERGVPIDPSNVVIIDLDLTDKRRKKALERV